MRAKLRWLVRTPFLDWGGETFREAYRTAVENHLARDAELVRTDPAIPPEKRDRELKNIERAIASFSEIFSETDEGVVGGCCRNQFRLPFSSRFIVTSLPCSRRSVF